MNKKISSIIFASAFASFAFADVVSDVEDARQNILSSIKEYNSSVSNVTAYATLLENRKSDIDTNINSANSIRSGVALSKTNFEDIKFQIQALKTSLDNSMKALSMVEEPAKNISAKFPVGDARIQLARDLINKGRELVSKNPGSEYQDKNYFDRISQNVDSSIYNLTQSQTQLSQNLVMLSVCAPRIDGIKKTLAMIDDYSSKIDAAIAKNTKDIEKANSCETDYKKYYIEKLEAVMSLSSAQKDLKSKIILAYADVATLMMNDIAQSKKHSEHIFKSVQLLDFAYEYRNWAESNMVMSKAVSDSFGLKSARDFQESLAKEEVAGIRAASVKYKQETPSTPKDVRAEILRICSDLSDLANEMNYSSKIITVISDNLRIVSFDVQNKESLSQTMLRTSIDLFGGTQATASEIQILESKNEVSKAQNKISDKEFSTLLAKASLHISQAAEFTKIAVEKTKSASEGLKK